MSALSDRSKQVRRDTIKLSSENGGYHYGGCFSCTEILIALFDHVLRPEDTFILSKGHSCWPYYALLREKGYQPKLQGHPSKSDGVPATTGSLGHGLPLGVGIAMAKKQKKDSGYVFVLVGDGECQEGTTWESALIASHHKLDNLVVIVDNNNIQGSDYLTNTLPIPFFIFRDIGWKYTEVDGHNVGKLVGVISPYEYLQDNQMKKPVFIRARTEKGQGVSFMEDEPKWHAKWLDFKHETKAYEELK